MYSLTVFLPQCSPWLTSLIKALFLFLLVILVFRPLSARQFIIQLLCFLAVNFIFAGVMLCVWVLFAPEGMVFDNGVIYFDISVPVLVICTFLGFAAAKLFGRAIKHKAPQNREYMLTIAVGERRVQVRSLLDTGNNLTDGFSARPVIIAEYNSISSLFDARAAVFFRDPSSLPAGREWSVRTRLVPYKGLGAEGLLPAFRPDSITISDGKNEFYREDTVIAVTKEKISGGEYAALLNILIFEGGVPDENSYASANQKHTGYNKPCENEALVGETLLCKQPSGASCTAHTRTGGGADLKTGSGRYVCPRPSDSP